MFVSFGLVILAMALVNNARGPLGLVGGYAGTRALRNVVDHAVDQGPRYVSQLVRGLRESYKRYRDSDFTQKQDKKPRRGAPPSRVSRPRRLATVSYKNVDFEVTALNMESTFPTICQILRQDPPGAVSVLTGISLGLGANQRVGRSAYVHSFLVKFEASLIPQLDLAVIGEVRTHYIYLYMVLDKQAGLDSPDASAIWSDQALGTGLFLRNLDYSSRFQILKTQKIRLTPQPFQAANTTADFLMGGDTTYGTMSYTFKKPKRITFDGPTGAIGESTSWNVLLYAASTLDAPAMRLFAHARTRFTG